MGCRHDRRRKNKKLDAIRGALFRTEPLGPFGEPKLLRERIVPATDDEPMKKFLTYVATLPVVPTDKLVSRQHLQVYSGSDLLSEVDLDPSVTKVSVEVLGSVTADPAPDATLQIQHFDEVPNPSPVATQTFTPIDTIGPDAPGPFGEIVPEGERMVEDDEPARPPVPVA